MIDRLFTAALAFTLLAGGTAAIGSAFADKSSGAGAAQATVKRLPTVEMEFRRAGVAPVARIAAGQSDVPVRAQ